MFLKKTVWNIFLSRCGIFGLVLCAGKKREAVRGRGNN